MSEIKVPELFQGTWDHVLILTYGANLPFWENALWGQLPARCRNRIILADGKSYLGACVSYARDGLIRRLNHQYVADGIFGLLTAHAKVILLTNEEKGRLLVGSGNLNLEGYASGGELFVCYEYGPDAQDALSAFQEISNLLQILIRREYLSLRLAQQRIEYLLEHTLWLSNQSNSDWRPVRHNFQQSFMEQLQEAIGSEQVEELWVLSPFYDQEATALRRMLELFRPQRSVLLMQPEYTSADPTAIDSVLQQFNSSSTECEVRRFGVGRQHPYYHAKLYLFKLATRAICLQGSPNLSQAAMLLTPPIGNLEVANLLVGERNDFDDLFDKLNIASQPETSIETLGISYQTSDESQPALSERWHLTGGELDERLLQLSFKGTLPEWSDARLLIAEREATAGIKASRYFLTCQLSQGEAKVLEHPLPVCIRWREDDTIFTSNPVYVCHRAELEAVLEDAGDKETLRGIGDLEVDDEEFERLLGELEAALVIDRRSVWQLAGRSIPAGIEVDDDALHLSYLDVDYEKLKQHPKLQRYLQGISSERLWSRSRLQIILGAITDHFRGLLGLSENSLAETISDLQDVIEEAEAETEEEREQEEEERQRKHWSQSQRIRAILKHFIRRYLQGLRSRDFQEWAGFEVVTNNYVIFGHLLFHLFGKRDWVEPEFIATSWIETIRFFWGDETQSGYWDVLQPDQQDQVLNWVREYHADAELYAGIFNAARVLTAQSVESYLNLRAVLRRLLVSPPFIFTQGILEATWLTLGKTAIDGPSPQPSSVVNELAALADFETEEHFLRYLERDLGLPSMSCGFVRSKVHRESIEQSVEVDVLSVNSSLALPDLDSAVRMITEWMAFDRNRDYYRISSTSEKSKRLVLYDRLSESGLYWDRDSRIQEALENLQPAARAWEPTLIQMATAAHNFELALEVKLPININRLRE